jgi:hypothetical protein
VRHTAESAEGIRLPLAGVVERVKSCQASEANTLKYRRSIAISREGLPCWLRIATRMSAQVTQCSLIILRPAQISVAAEASSRGTSAPTAHERGLRPQVTGSARIPARAATPMPVIVLAGQDNPAVRRTPPCWASRCGGFRCSASVVVYCAVGSTRDRDGN